MTSKPRTENKEVVERQGESRLPFGLPQPLLGHIGQWLSEVDVAIATRAWGKTGSPPRRELFWRRRVRLVIRSAKLKERIRADISVLLRKLRWSQRALQTLELDFDLALERLHEDSWVGLSDREQYPGLRHLFWYERTEAPVQQYVLPRLLSLAPGKWHTLWIDLRGTHIQQDKNSGEHSLLLQGAVKILDVLHETLRGLALYVGSGAVPWPIGERILQPQRFLLLESLSLTLRVNDSRWLDALQTTAPQLQTLRCLDPEARNAGEIDANRLAAFLHKRQEHWKLLQIGVPGRNFFIQKDKGWSFHYLWVQNSLPPDDVKLDLPVEFVSTILRTFRPASGWAKVELHTLFFQQQWKAMMESKAEIDEWRFLYDRTNAGDWKDDDKTAMLPATLLEQFTKHHWKPGRTSLCFQTGTPSAVGSQTRILWTRDQGDFFTWVGRSSSQTMAVCIDHGPLFDCCDITSHIGTARPTAAWDLEALLLRLRQRVPAQMLSFYYMPSMPIAGRAVHPIRIAPLLEQWKTKLLYFQLSPQEVPIDDWKDSIVQLQKLPLHRVALGTREVMQATDLTQFKQLDTMHMAFLGTDAKQSACVDVKLLAAILHNNPTMIDLDLFDCVPAADFVGAPDAASVHKYWAPIVRQNAGDRGKALVSFSFPLATSAITQDELKLLTSLRPANFKLNIRFGPDRHPLHRLPFPRVTFPVSIFQHLVTQPTNGRSCWTRCNLAVWANVEAEAKLHFPFVVWPYGTATAPARWQTVSAMHIDMFAWMSMAFHLGKDSSGYGATHVRFRWNSFNPRGFVQVSDKGNNQVLFAAHADRSALPPFWQQDKEFLGHLTPYNLYFPGTAQEFFPPTWMWFMLYCFLVQPDQETTLMSYCHRPNGRHFIDFVDQPEATDLFARFDDFCWAMDKTMHHFTIWSPPAPTTSSSSSSSSSAAVETKTLASKIGTSTRPVSAKNADEKDEKVTEEEEDRLALAAAQEWDERCNQLEIEWASNEAQRNAQAYQIWQASRSQNRVN